MQGSATAQSKQVFLSYSRTDREACIALRWALEQAGLSVFQDEDGIRGSDRWQTTLQEALQGCSAFVLLVGRDGVQRWVGAEVEIALTRHLSPHDDAERLPIFPILLEEDGKLEALPPLLALFQSTRWSPTEPLPAPLIEAIKNRAILIAYQDPIEGCPFLGLNAFGRGDARLFFGRRKETLEALAGLGDQRESNPERLQGSGGAGYDRWLQIEGNSGAGKSSLVNAGMLPMIERGALWARTGFEHWRVLGPMMPGKDPLTKLAEVFEHGLIADPVQRNLPARLQQMEASECGLALALRGFKRDRSAFLLIVDQFEEFYTFADDAPRKQFDALLANALEDPECPLFLISTVRADFLDRLEHVPRLQGIYNKCKRNFLPTISEHGLREVIEEPARLAGLDVSEVSAAILADARDEIGALPLVENALFSLWQHREANRLSGKRYRQQDGIAGMLSAQADILLEQIDRTVPKGRRAALELLLRLTRVNDEGRHTRQRISRDEAVDVAGHGKDSVGERVVQLLSGERPVDVPGGSHTGALRLITTSTEQDRQYVDLIHETLIRARPKDEKTGKRIPYWPTLYDYIEKNRDRDIHRQQLKFQTEQWVKGKGLGRWRNLAGWRDRRLYRRLRVRKDSDEGRFLIWSRRKAWAQLVLLLSLIAFFGESYYWTWKHDLPLHSMVMQQCYRLGYRPVPELVAIPAGSFDMGEQSEEFLKELPEKYFPNFGVPGKHVDIAEGFRLGKYEVTYEQYDGYVWDRHRAGHGAVAYPTTAKGGRGTHPVVNVTWHEAMAYAAWLGEGTHQDCRLPTEAEWEYAARAMTNTGYPWGNEIRRKRDDQEEVMANCADCGSSWVKDQSAPVGSFQPNAFGLHDTSGNVWEWTCSRWQERFDGNEQVCADQKDTETRVVRGGSWSRDPAGARSAARDDNYPDGRFVFVGFRVLCSSPIE